MIGVMQVPLHPESTCHTTDLVPFKVSNIKSKVVAKVSFLPIPIVIVLSSNALILKNDLPSD
jgi:hypothetical protein